MIKCSRWKVLLICTLGGGAIFCLGRGSTRFRIVARWRRAFDISSPAWSDGIVVDGGFWRIFTISPAACLKKSFMVTLGKGTVDGKIQQYQHVW